MNAIVDLAFKVDDILDPDRIHHLYFPAILTTSDGSLETKNMTLSSDSIENMKVYVGKCELDTGYVVDPKSNAIFRCK